MVFMDEQPDGYAEGEEPVIFHYKKGDFRKREPKVYADLATGKTLPSKGLFKALVSTRGNKFMFFTLIMVFALVLIVSLLSGKANENVINGIYCNLDSFSYEGTVYSSVELKVSENSGKRIFGFKVPSSNEEISIKKEIYAIFLFYDSDGDFLDKREVKYEFDSDIKDEKFIRSAITDFSVSRVECEIRIEEDEILLKQTVKKR